MYSKPNMTHVDQYLNSAGDTLLSFLKMMDSDYRLRLKDYFWEPWKQVAVAVFFLFFF